GITTRPQIEVDFESLTSALSDLGRELTGLDHLRTYWYDGATDRVPTATHLAVARLGGVIFV
ncbi:MAG: NYN domain-containing protein, partial [Actinobacteria bacterium]|nr:NYN domain-containing protein [Actinomycetota bacterium]